VVNELQLAVAFSLEHSHYFDPMLQQRIMCTKI
jgi:hypothetical protein